MEKLNENKGAVIAIALILILVSSMVGGYYLITHLSPPEGYSTINLLDAQQKKAIDYPELLILNHNNTCSVYFQVENHMGATRQFQMQLKVTNETITTLPIPVAPVSNYTETLENGQTWENLATFSINQPGNYSAVFELWLFDGNSAFTFTYDYCVLPLEVIDQA